MRGLRFVLNIHEVSGKYLAVPNVDSVYQLNERLFIISHHHIFHPVDPMYVDGCNGNFIDGAVHVFDHVVVVEVFLLLLVDNVNDGLHR